MESRTESVMNQKSEIDGVPDPSVDAYMTAGHWWRDDDAWLLPGEQGGVTVFEIRFWDGCRHLAHTDAADTTVFERVGWSGGIAVC